MIALLLGLLSIVAQASPSTQPAAPPAPPSSYVPQRVYDTHRKEFTDFETMLAELGKADVIFIGEQHDDPNTHRLELAVLEGLTRRGVPLIVAMEMFERDAQPAVDQYVSGAFTEEQFLAASRPWPRYKSDYRPAFEFARAHGIPIVASNVPRRIAADVSKNGLGVLDSLAADRQLAAADPECPTKGDYYDRFVDLMKEHPAGKAVPPEDARQRNDRFYLAQCVKDETMGESLAKVLEKSDRRPTVVHINGAFHSDYGEGAAGSARRRLPGKRIVVVSILPVADLDAVHPGRGERKRARYLVYTVSAAAPASRQ